jgi:hypothetical protein
MRIVNRNFPQTVRLRLTQRRVRVARQLRTPTVDAPGALKAIPQPLAVRRRALAPRIPTGPQPLLAILQTRPIAQRELAPATIARQVPITAALHATLRIVRRVPWAAGTVPIRLLLPPTVAILLRHALTLRLLMAAAAATPLLVAIRLHHAVTPLPVMVAVVRVVTAVAVLAVIVVEEALRTAAAEAARTAVVVADPTAAVAATVVVAAVDITKIFTLLRPVLLTKAGLLFFRRIKMQRTAVYFSRLLHLRPQLFCLRCVTHSDAEDSVFIPRCA